MDRIVVHRIIVCSKQKNGKVRLTHTLSKVFKF